jgi:hypothetical protein
VVVVVVGVVVGIAVGIAVVVGIAVGIAVAVVVVVGIAVGIAVVVVVVVGIAVVVSMRKLSYGMRAERRQEIARVLLKAGRAMTPMEILQETTDASLSIQSIVTTAKGAPMMFRVDIEPGGKTTTTIQLHHHLRTA